MFALSLGCLWTTLIHIDGAWGDWVGFNGLLDYWAGAKRVSGSGWILRQHHFIAF